MDAVTIVGAGGIGCAVGYALAAAGCPVTFVEASRSKVVAGRRLGVQVEGREPLAANFCLFDDWRPRSHDLILLCTKCYDNAAILARVPADVQLIPIQNGFDDALRARPDSIEGIASFVSECAPDEPRTRITRRGDLHLGFRDWQVSCRKEDEARLANLVNRLAQARLFRVIQAPNIQPYKHTKLMYNAAISPLAAAAGLDNGELLRLPLARRWFFALLQENYQILHGAGIELGKIGPFHPDTVRRILQHSFLARLLGWVFYPSLRGTYCSMHGDVKTGRTELENYNGYLIRLAGERPCPANRAVYRLVKQMEHERQVPSRSMLNRLAA